MKRVFVKIKFMIIAAFAVTFMSCGGDKYPSEGYFNIGETSYNINEARLEDTGFSDGYYQLRLTMDNTEHNDFHSINFLFYSEVNTYLPSATYKPYLYDGDFNDKFKRGGWVIGNDIEGVIMSGTVKVTKTNDIYTIRIDCNDVEGKQITGYYNGEIKLSI